MSKKRILALFLALALAIPSNASVVFAAEATDLETPIVEVEETEVIPEELTEEVVEEILQEEVTEVVETEGVVAEEPVLEEGEVEEVTPDEAVVVDPNAKKCITADPNGVAKWIISSGYPSTVVIPKEVTVIPSGFFTKSRAVTTIEFEEGSQLTTIEPHAFTYESKVESIVKLPATVTELPEEMFGDYVTDTKGNTTYKAAGIDVITFEDITTLTTIGNRCFAGTDITTLDLRSSAVEIGANAFEASELRTIYLPNGLTEIPNDAFHNCDDLQYVYLNNGLKKIGENAFASCDVLEEINIPGSVSEIASGAFAECASLKRVYVRGNSGENGECAVTFARDSFPNKSLTMYSWDGTAKEYAGTMGYTFETLFPIYSISTRINDEEAGWIDVKESARPGDKVEFYYEILDEEYELVEGSLSVNGGTVELEYVKPCVYRFVMPETDVVIRADFAELEEDVKITVEAEEAEGITFTEIYNSSEKVEYYLDFAKVGQISALRIFSDGREMSPSAYTFASSNENVAKVTSSGEIYSVGYGYKATNPKEYKVTATPIAGGNKITVYVTVGKGSEAKNIYTEFGSADFTFTKRNQTDDDIILDVYEVAEDGTFYKVVRFDSSTLGSSGYNFDVKMSLKDKEGKEMAAQADWAVVDGNIASRSYSSTVDGKNKINVKKGALGETAVTVTIKVKEWDETKGKAVEKKYVESFVIEVVDKGLRLEESTVSAYKKAEPTPITLVDSYSNRVANIDWSTVVVKKITTEDGVKVEKNVSGIKVYEENNQVYLKVSAETNTKADDYVKNATYSKNLKIQGYYMDGTPFTVAIEKLVVADQIATPSYVLAVTKNTYYQNVRKDSYELQVVDKKTKMPVLLPADVQISEVKDTLGVEASVNEYGVITLDRGSESVVQKGAVTLQLNHVSWKKPIKLTYTVATSKTLPALKLSATKATMTANVDQMTSVNVTNLAAIEAMGLYLGSVSAASQLDITYNAGKIEIAGNVPAGTYKILVTANVFGNGVSENLKPVTITVTVTDKAPSVTVKASGKINVLDKYSEIKYVPTFKNTNNTVDWVVLSGTGAAYFNVRHDGVNAYVSANEANMPKAGTTYTIQMKFAVSGGNEVVTKDVKIKPVATQPKLAVAPATVTMFAGQRYEQRRKTVDIIKTTETGAKITEVKWGKASDSIKDAFILLYDDHNEMVTIALRQPGKLTLNKTYSLNLIPTYEGQTEAEAAKNKAITIKVNLKK